MTNQDRFKLAQECINQVDDLFEYAYKSYETPELLQARVMEILANYTYKQTAKTGVEEWTNYNETTTNQ